MKTKSRKEKCPICGKVGRKKHSVRVEFIPKKGMKIIIERLYCSKKCIGEAEINIVTNFDGHEHIWKKLPKSREDKSDFDEIFDKVFDGKFPEEPIFNTEDDKKKFEEPQVETVYFGSKKEEAKKNE